MENAVAVLTDSDGFECEEASVGGNPASSEELPFAQGFRSICFPGQGNFIVELPISSFEVTLCDSEH